MFVNKVCNTLKQPLGVLRNCAEDRLQRAYIVLCNPITRSALEGYRRMSEEAAPALSQLEPLRRCKFILARLLNDLGLCLMSGLNPKQAIFREFNQIWQQAYMPQPVSPVSFNGSVVERARTEQERLLLTVASGEQYSFSDRVRANIVDQIVGTDRYDFYKHYNLLHEYIFLTLSPDQTDQNHIQSLESQIKANGLHEFASSIISDITKSKEINKADN